MIAHIPIVATDADLEAISEANPGWQVERESDGSVIMSPTCTSGGARSGEAFAQVRAWSREEARGVVFDSSTGFTMPDTAVLSPDVAWIDQTRWDALSEKQRETYAPIVPDIAIEIVSQSDSGDAARRKAVRYIAYGVRYAVVIDPYRRETFEYGERPENLILDLETIYEI